MLRISGGVKVSPDEELALYPGIAAVCTPGDLKYEAVLEKVTEDSPHRAISATPLSGRIHREAFRLRLHPEIIAYEVAQSLLAVGAGCMPCRTGMTCGRRGTRCRDSLHPTKLCIAIDVGTPISDGIIGRATLHWPPV